MALLAFGPWLPDSPDNDAGSSPEITNAVPGYGLAYEPQAGLSTFSTSLSSRCQGAIACQDTTLATYWFAGSHGDLWRIESVTWSNVSVAGGYSTSTDGTWSFAQYGDTIYATNRNDPMQFYSLGAGAAFAAVGGAAPQARRLAIVKNFLVAVNVVGSPQRIQWSGLDAPLSWTVDSTTQADFQDLLGSGGQNVGVAVGLLGSDAAIFQQRAVWRMTYAGLPNVFDFALVEGVRGTPAPDSIITLEGKTFYLGENGFYVFDGMQSQPIGASKIDRTFFTDADPALLYRTSGVVDTTRRLLFWAYVSTASADGNPDRVLVYNYATATWSRLNLSVELLWQSLSFGYTLDQLDVFFGGDIDAFTVSFDSSQWQGGLRQFSAFDTSHRTSHFTGTRLAATFTTAEALLPEPRRFLTTQVWPIIECRSATADVVVSVGHRDRPIDTVTYATGTSPNTVGFCPQRTSTPYARYRMSVSAGAAWSRAFGLDVRTGASTEST